MRQPSQKINLITWQGSIILISLVTALVPQYYWLFFLLYFVIIMGVMFRSTRKMTKIPPSSELGAPLFKEKQAVKIALLDKTLSEELKKQATASMMMLGMTVLVLALFYAYRALAFGPVHEILTQYFDNPVLVTFLDFLIMYEVVTGLLSLPRFALMGKLTAANIMLPQRFVVYRKGIVANDRFFIEFSSDMCYTYDLKRKYVEVRSISKKGARIRLYTDSISTLVEKIKSLNITPCPEHGDAHEEKT